MNSIPLRQIDQTPPPDRYARGWHCLGLSTSFDDKPKANEELYYDKMSDELLRYGNIQMFVFREKSFLTLENINYNLRDNEILILESLLDKDYFADIEENKRNDYLKSISYDNLKPSKYLPKHELPKHELPIKIKKKQMAKLRIKE